MEVTESGIVTFTNASQLLNAQFPIDFKLLFSPKVTEDNLLQSLKALSPMEATDAGITISVKFTQPLKALFGIAVTLVLLLNITFVIEDFSFSHGMVISVEKLLFVTSKVPSVYNTAWLYSFVFVSSAKAAAENAKIKISKTPMAKIFFISFLTPPFPGNKRIPASYTLNIA